MSKPLSHPSHIIVAKQQQALKYALSMVQKAVCRSQECGHCSICTSIKNNSCHESFLIIKPEERYTLASLEPIFNTITLTLDHGTSFFFIITQAELLTLGCSNSLLKIVEEPPRGYHFIFLTERFSQLLPTIISRSLITRLTQTITSPVFSSIGNHFARINANPLTFLKDLQQCTMTEHECLQEIDHLLSYWIAFYKKALREKNDAQSSSSLIMVNLLKEAISNPPQPGSAKIFWKNLFLQKTDRLSYYS